MDTIPKLYLDENISVSMAKGLRTRGFDVISADEVGNKTLSDEEQLVYASSQERAILTCDTSDFTVLYAQYLEQNKTHCGIILSTQYPIGIMLRKTENLLIHKKSSELKNQLLYLNQW